MPDMELEDTDALDTELPVQDEAVAATAQADAGESPADAASSTATDGSKTDGDETLSVVQDVVDRRGKSPAAASSAKAEEDGSDPDAEGTGDDEYSDVPFNKHPRFKEVLSKLKTAEVDATRYRNVQTFLDGNGLSGEDAANGLVLLARSRSEGLTGDEMADGLQIMALAKTDPATAWKRIQPWVQKVIIAAGEYLPDDLSSRVQNGEMSQEAALELSRARAAQQSYEARQSFAEQQAQARRQTEAVSSLQTAAADWQKRRETRDPEFAAKMPAIVAEVQKLQSLGYVPTSPAAVEDQLNRAYAAVNGAIRRPAPAAAASAARPAIKPVVGGQVAGNTGTAPQSTTDVIMARLAKRRAG